MKKGAVCALLFCLSAYSLAKNKQSDLETLSQDPTWSALIHFYQGKPTIENSAFYLSDTNNFSLFDELKATIQFLRSSKDAVCRFPARAQFLSEHAIDVSMESDHCDELNEFQTKAPSDSIYITYTSENLSQPSSAMGHIMLMLHSKTDQGGLIEHGVSYFTELESYNPISIIYDTIIKGKTGYFQVSPYQSKAIHYKFIEGRNIWEYPVAISEDRKSLLRKHIWELKHAPPIYYFHKYNCATLTLNLLTIANTNLSHYSRSNVSPLDVIKYAVESDAVMQPVVQLSPNYEVKMLLEALPYQLREQVFDSLASQTNLDLNQSSIPQQYLIDRLTKAGELLSKLNRDNTNWRPIKDSLKNAGYDNNREELQLNLANYKKPTDRHYDSSLTLEAALGDDISTGKIKYVPASHLLTDSSYHLFGVNSLEIMTPTLEIYSGGDVNISELTLYAFDSYVPYDPITKSISGSIDISIQNPRKQEPYTSLGGSIGYSVNSGSSHLIYGLVGGTVELGAYNRFVPSVDIGYVFEPNPRFKTLINYNFRTLAEDQDNYQSLSITSSFSTNKQSRLLVGGTLNKSDLVEQEFILNLGYTIGFL